ncbi:hypothetical protein BO94DRAFT_523284 [Aspergillus sclerotioniger CBS 115572]|uniref:HCNGP-domain-containing protein n=1 Tax=Aspergillus sclerotioniger CBS 115572 TaxID=1450535 RepID=A0A317VTS6_9EURO|nr:hypothetical protein BO94DRAFT_523284 [Aspergillus sclerotioniger CBS 115572]PWY76352.1 hypothetical protein BO94DRAFT_523284 [Aspergillus sclerotioniger CBS 115572]
MLGLAAYDSSSDDEVENKSPSIQPKKGDSQHSQPLQVIKDTVGTVDENTLPEKTPVTESYRPVLGPTHEQDPHHHPTEASQNLSANRTLIHDLTLPPIPNLDIPLSPSGSPNPAANAKFAHFLSLKKQGMHFNDKLAGSTSLKNPSLLNKMMDHAGIDDQAQYHASLPPEVWNANDLPSWGFKDELLKAQREIQNKAEERKLAGQRDAINFVAATPRESTRTGSVSSSRTKQR